MSNQHGEWTGYTLRPADVWFFRDSKPSLGGEDHYLRSIFPPLPSTLFGLVRTQRLLELEKDPSHANQGWWNALSEDIQRELGEFGGYGRLTMRGPWLRRGDEILFPVPADLRLRVRREAHRLPKIETIVRLLPVARARGERANWSHPLDEMRPFTFDGKRWTEWHTAPRQKDPQPASGWYVTSAGLERWIAGGVPPAEQFVAPQDLWDTEMRTGVGLVDDRPQRIHKEGSLFTFGFIRLRPEVAIGFDLSGGTLVPEAWARFGGENRLARIGRASPVSSSTIGSALADALPNDDAVIALATPGVFREGALPREESVSAAVIPGNLLAGGWDLARHEPKALQRGVPAGSVYWTKRTEREGDLRSEKYQEGFGLMFVGRQPRRDDG